MPSVRLTPEARESILGLWEWGVDNHGLERADKFVDALHKKFKDIAKMPYASTDSPKLGDGIRSRPFQGYTIFFIPEDDGILVVRVYRGSRNFQALFSRDPIG